MKELVRYKNLIVGLLILAVSLFLLNSVYSHYSVRLQKLGKEEDKIKEVSRTVVEWTQRSGLYSKLQDKFLKDDELLVKKFIEEQARANGIELPSLRVSSSDKETFWEVKVKLQTTCDYADFVKFVDSLAERNIEVVAASLSSAGDKVSISADVKGVVVK